MSNFSDYLLKSIKNRDVKAIRGALNGYIDSDPAFKTSKFDDAVRHVENSDIQVFEEMDDELPVPDGPYNESLFYEIRAGLQSNYSKERIEALKKVGKSCMQNAKVYIDIGAVKESQTSAKGTINRNLSQGNGGTPPKKDLGHQQKIIIVMAVLMLVVLIIIIAIVMRKK